MNNNPSDINPIQKIKEIIKKYNLNNYKIYLASDTIQKISELKNEFGDKLIYNINNTYIAKTMYDKYEPHYGFALIDNQHNNQFMEEFYRNKPGINGGKQLLIDVLLLSKCNIFLPTESNVSRWPFIFNPEIDEE
jgi:hypothetical protein